jgi:hypothetical protein
MSIVEREDALFKRWAIERPGFVKDGVMDEVTYLSSPTKMVFILKEANDPGGGGWDLRQKIREKCEGLWVHVARWAYGIANMDRDVQWDELEPLGEHVKVFLKSVCIMNAKKCPGGGVAESKGLQDIVEKDAVFIREQFEIYNPDLIICCGTRWLLDLIAVPEQPGDLKFTRRGIGFREFRPGKFQVAYWHPGARMAPCLLHYGLVDAVRELQTVYR